MNGGARQRTSCGGRNQAASGAGGRRTAAAAAAAAEINKLLRSEPAIANTVGHKHTASATHSYLFAAIL